MAVLAVLLPALITAVVHVLKALFGTDKPQERTVIHVTPELPVTDGKTRAQRLRELGLA